MAKTHKLTRELAHQIDRQFDELKADERRNAQRYASIHKQYEKELGPVLAAYRSVRGSVKGPTPYGHTDVEESFAESFALYKADPIALRRIYPDVYTWFAAGGHLQALREALGEEVLPLNGVRIHD